MTNPPPAAITAAAGVMLRQYEDEHNADHLSWQDFAHQANEVLAAALPHLTPPPPDSYHPPGSCDACAEPPDLDMLRDVPSQPDRDTAFTAWWDSLPDGWPVTEAYKRCARAGWEAATRAERERILHRYERILITNVVSPEGPLYDFLDELRADLLGGDHD